MGDDNILTVALKMGFLGGSDDKESASNVGDLGLIPGLGRSPTRAWQPTPVFLPGEFPQTVESGGLQSMGHRVGHDGVIKCSMAFNMMLRVLMPGPHYETHFK